MQANRGDQIVVETTTLAAARRRGEVLEVIGGGERERYRVRLDDGHESVYFPRPRRPRAAKRPQMKALTPDDVSRRREP